MKPLGPIPAGYHALDGELAIGGHKASALVAQAGGTPLFVYSAALGRTLMASLRAAMPEQLITRQEEFDDLCGHIRQCRVVAFDTEFVAEDYFRPRLCLLQFATPEQVAAVDPFDVTD